MLKKTVRWFLRILLALLGLVLLVIVAAYIPPIQIMVLKAVLNKVNQDPDMEITVDHLRLSPPLRVSAKGVTIVQQGDTLLNIGAARVRVAFWPLLAGEIKVSRVGIEETRFNMGNTDSAMCLRAVVGAAKIDDARIKLSSKSVNIKEIAFVSPDVDMKLRPDTTPSDTTSSAPLPWKINIKDINAWQLTYRMSTEGSIDSLGVNIPMADIRDVSLDMENKTVKVKSFTVDDMTAAFLTPPVADEAAEAAPPSDEASATDTIPSQPWSISVDSIGITASDALYGVYGATPQPGLDMNYLRLSKIRIGLDSILSRGSELRLPIRKIAARERCGLDMELSGLFAMDSGSIAASNIVLATQFSRLQLDATMTTGDTPLPSPLNVKAGGYISPVDVVMAMPHMKPTLAGIPSNSAVEIDIDINGADGLYNVDALTVEMPKCFTIGANGSIANPPSIDDMNGLLTLHGRVYNSRFLERALDGSVAVPPMVLKGDVRFRSGLITGRLDAKTRSGRLALDADWRARRESYDLTLKADSFPVEAFLPALDVKKLSTDITVKGRGYDFTSTHTEADAAANIAEVTYLDRTYRDITLSAHLADGSASIRAASPNPIAQLTIAADGNMAGETYDWHLSADVTNLDMRAMGLSDSVMHGKIALTGDMTYSPAFRRSHGQSITGRLNISSLDWTMSSNHFATTDLIADFATNDSLTAAAINNHDLHTTLTMPMPLDTIMSRLNRTTAVLDSASATRRLDVDRLQAAMPQLDFNFSAGTNNVVNDFLNSQDMEFTSARFSMKNDSLINFGGRLLNVTKGATVIDTVDIRGYQVGAKLLFDLHIGNRPGTLDEWAQVTASGEIDADHASILLDQQNISGLTGYHLGFLAKFFDDYLTVHVIPHEPVIGYKDWVVNDSNYIALNMGSKHLDANLLMRSSESSIHLYTDHSQASDSIQEDVVLDIKNIKLSEWIAVNPFAPPVAGSVSADMRFGWDDRSIGGSGLVSINDLTYGKERVGSFDLGLDLQTNNEGTVRAAATLMVDSIKTITAEGNLNDSTARNPFLLDFKMIHFPLTVLNPFLPADMARLSGTLNGTMDITGSLAEPIFNGFIDFDRATLRVPMIGTTYTFSDAKLPVDSNVVNINNFTIQAANENPLMINGTVDARHLRDVKIDIDARATNMQAIGSKKGKGVQIIGKAFINLLAGIHGNLSRLDVNANLTLLPTTDITYLMSSTSSGGSLTSQSTGDVVKFVNFADTVAVESADTVSSSGMLMKLDAILRIQEGATINIDLSSNGKDRIQLLPSGTLDYNSNYMGDTRLTGRLNVNKGYVRYSPPIISEKNFSFQPGSYVSFSGDMLNPYINLKAVDVLKANVEQDGQNSRLINFDVILNITNTLDNINVAFDLSTKDDITVANELQSMTPEQRANQAMNLMLYNVYTGPGTKANASLSGNPLYSFLESQINGWAANNIKGVDLSFGIDQYDRTVDGSSSTATSYSYKMSKSLFNNRFKISIGGNYATEDDANQNLAQNLINDISFEYYITPTGSMYVKIFRHTGYESILEGEVTQTGVGFVYKRKLRKLGDLFLPVSYMRKRAIKAAAEREAKDAVKPGEPTTPTAP